MHGMQEKGSLLRCDRNPRLPSQTQAKLCSTRSSAQGACFPQFCEQAVIQCDSGTRKREGAYFFEIAKVGYG